MVPAAAPTQATLPAVSALHKAEPMVPSGWVNVKMRFGTWKTANVMSAIARLTSSQLNGVL